MLRRGSFASKATLKSGPFDEWCITRAPMEIQRLGVNGDVHRTCFVLTHGLIASLNPTVKVINEMDFVV